MYILKGWACIYYVQLAVQNKNHKKTKVILLFKGYCQKWKDLKKKKIKSKNKNKKIEGEILKYFRHIYILFCIKMLM